MRGWLSGHRAQASWTVVLALLAALSALAADHRGKLSRRAFDAPPEFRGGRWGLVRDAAAAVDLWEAAGLHGRRLLVATGRWGQPVATGPPAPLPEEPPGDAGAAAALAARVNGALFDATMRALARELVVVMPDAAFGARIEAIRASRETSLGAGWARQPFHGIPRSFHRPSTLPHLDEEVLLLVEPSFFAAGAPPDLVAWLASRGVRYDLALVAARDPEASPEQLEAALTLAERVGAAPVEVER